MATSNDTSWHAVEADEAFDSLDSSEEGLRDEEAKRRLEKYGRNVLKPPHHRGALVRFFSHFHNVLIYILLIAAAVTALLDHLTDTAVILGVVIINAIIGFLQEGKAERAIESIAKSLSIDANVIRQGERRTIPAEEVVPGDVVVLSSGDKVPADTRLFSADELRADEAALTGESVPVEKSTEVADESATVGDRPGMAFSGTVVTSGEGRGVVVATGERSEIGRISKLVARTKKLQTPLMQQVSRFGRWLSAAILLIAAALFAFGFFLKDYSAEEMFLASVAVAVAAIPQGLPAIMAITLAIGVQQMARRQALIRRLPAVDTLGAVTVICSDKTGTLTRNEMTVKTIATIEGAYEISGEGYDPEGAFSRDDNEVKIDDEPLLKAALHAGLLCNDGDVAQEDDAWTASGDPMEAALVATARKAGLDHDEREKTRRDEIPFESDRRYMATLDELSEEGRMIHVKGAPERVIDMCSRQMTREGEEEIDAGRWHELAEQLAGKGQRVLALARKSADDDADELQEDDVERDLVMLGLAGLIDPPREEAIDAVAICKEANIRVKMVTGDHKATALAIGEQFGIGDGETATTGEEIEDQDDKALRDTVRDIDVYARVSPEHKLRLVETLQDDDQIVAMTGDGVNDAPALKRANVGVAMGIKGTEAAKEASEMVLADDNFASIKHAVEEGRTVYDNLRKAVVFLLPTNGGEALTIICAIAIGAALPITPVQILWVNMVTAVTLGLALAFDPAEPDIMKRPPRSPQQSLLSLTLAWRVVFVSILLAAGTFGLYLIMRNAGVELEVARTVAVNTLVMFEVFYLFNVRSLDGPSMRRPVLLGSRYALIAVGLVIGFQMLFTYVPIMQQLFGTAAIDWRAWAMIVPVAASVFALVELEKWAMRTWRARQKKNER